jgi:uncharacterized protein
LPGEELHYEPHKIVLFGESMGGAVALSLWATEPEQYPAPATVVLRSTFCSLTKLASQRFPIYPFQFLLWDKWPSLERMSHITCPVMVIHGTDDEIIPFSHGEQLATKAQRGSLIPIPRAGHNDIAIYQIRKELVNVFAMVNKNAQPEPK